MQVKTIKGTLTDAQTKEYREYHADTLEKLKNAFALVDCALKRIGNAINTATATGKDSTVKLMFAEEDLGYNEIWKDWNNTAQLIHTLKMYRHRPPLGHQPENWAYGYLDQSDLKRANKIWKRYANMLKSKELAERIDYDKA